MNYEQINQRLFAHKISNETVEKLVHQGYIPEELAKAITLKKDNVRELLHKWRNTFTGSFLSKRPKHYPVLRQLCNLLGKQPAWSDFTTQNITDIAEYFKRKVSPSSAKTYLSAIKATLNENKDEHTIPSGRYDDILKSKSSKSTAVYLTMDEIKRLEQYQPEGYKESIILAQFLCECFTGARRSDVLQFNEGNIDQNKRYLTYVSQKTGVETQVEAKSGLSRLIKIAGQKQFSDAFTNNMLRNICRKCGINEIVTIFRGGKAVTDEKWKFVATHTARRSFATNLAELNVPILQISKRMGHTKVDTTLGYIVSPINKLDDKQMEFFL